MPNLPSNQDPTHNAYANGRPATDKQLSYINGLRDSRELSETDTIKLGRALDRGFNTREASDIIKWLQTQPVKAVEITAPVAVAELAAGQSIHEPVEVTDGMWVLGDTIYKVQYNKATGDGRRLYAKRLVVSEDFGYEEESVHTISFEYERGALRRLETGGARSLTAEEAKEFGALYGVCVVKGCALTHERSIVNGYGPKCAENMGWPY